VDLEALKKSADEQRRQDVSDGIIKFLAGWAFAVFTAFFTGAAALWALKLVQESLWFLPLLLLALAFMAFWFYVAATGICEPINIDGRGYRLGLTAILVLATALYFDHEIEPWGKGPHLKRVFVAPRNAFRVGEVEWTRTDEGPALGQIKFGDGKTLDLYSCEGDTSSFDAICIGENDHEWVVLPFKR
jgi:hypothetical protein